MAPIGNAVFATLLTNDAYLPGAMVLGHSLKDKGAKAKLVAAVVIEKLAENSIAELKTVWDEIVPVQQIQNNAPANLYLMNRPDLISTFTKIQLWKQTQYKRVVYIDADVVALRAPNELLTMETDFAAVPDIGWPDCFNSGVMVLNPNMADYYALLALAERGISFDGADQGLLNMHFTEWDKLGFKYNCTPSANYQYVPAYRHFQSSISLIHFIGKEKPWSIGRGTQHKSGVYAELLGRWWAVYDRYYHTREVVYYEGEVNQAPKKLQDYVAGEETLYLPTYLKPPAVSNDIPTINVQPPEAIVHSEQPLGDQPTMEEQITSDDFEPTPTVQQRKWSAPHTEWEPSRAPPPTGAKPEASNFPSQIYDFSQDVKLFQPPPEYPDAPKGMWYEVPAKAAPEPKPKHIFPWEERAPKATRVFPPAYSVTPSSESQASTTTTQISEQSQSGSQSQSASTPLSTTSQTSNETPQPEPKLKQIFPWESRAPKATRVFPSEYTPTNPLFSIAQPTEGQPTTSSQTVSQSSNQASIESEATSTKHPTTDTRASGPEAGVGAYESSRSGETDSSEQTGSGTASTSAANQPVISTWDTFRDRSNAWDDMPDINRYVQALQPPKRGKIQVLHHSGAPSASGLGQLGSALNDRRESLKVTDFPTENERPSLPVTPAPIGRPTYWGDEKEMSGELPDAEGVPNQTEWVRRSPFHSKSALDHLSSLLQENNGVLCLKCQYCGEQNPVAKLEELQRRQSQALFGKQSLDNVREAPKRELPESATLEEVEAAVEKATSPTSTRPLKPILKEPRFELSNDIDSSTSTKSNGLTYDEVTEDVVSPLEVTKSEATTTAST